MQIANIEASEDVVMTEPLLRAFAAEGCDPTVCHACKKKIKVGDIFKLVPHQADGEGYTLDEMCCARCGEPELVKRDKRDEKALAKRQRENKASGGSGYSRISAAEKGGGNG